MAVRKMESCGRRGSLAGQPRREPAFLASPSPGVYKYALSKRGFAIVGPGERAGKKNPTLSPR